MFFRIREQSALVQTLRNLPSYSEIPPQITDFLEFNSRSTLPQPSFDPLRILTQTPNLPTPPVATSPHSHAFARMNSGTTMTTSTQQFNPIGAIGKENASQKGV